MSRKPVTPNDDEGPAGSGQQQTNISVGRRFSGNDELLRIEDELVAEGHDLPNRAIPIAYHVSNLDGVDVDQVIADEAERDHPNKALIGYLNEVRGK